MDMPTLETERLRVRPFTMDDLPHVFLYPDGQRRREWLAWTVASCRQLALLYQPPYGERAVTLRDTDELIGAVGLVPSFGPFHTLPSRHREAGPGAPLNSPEMGLFYEFRPEFQGRGYATEAVRAIVGYAFGTLDMRRLVATTEYDNVRSQALMRRLGMTVEHNPAPEPHWFQVVGTLENDTHP